MVLFDLRVLFFISERVYLATLWNALTKFV